ncbi:hypothetical protein QBZ16_003487 [Prototheca wickerhamii]|uniref:SAGA-associated factor 11 n=1 Tax=Prototheca wickerhamii TaxID=3111 RepID=A0AAD9MIM2_PROWI|nr:hypothetical protein QBZ16_003487 [Prototheca wickerhamii]
MAKKLDVGLEERLLRARLAYVKDLQSALAEDGSLVRLSLQDDLRHAHNVQASKGMPPPVRLLKTAQAEDAFGTPVNAMPIAPVACPSCGRRVAASRFANHLDKCLHRASR